MVRVVLVGFLPDNHGRSCEAHPYGCGNALIKGEGNGVGCVARLHLVEKVHLACHKLKGFHNHPDWDYGAMDLKLVGNDVKYSTRDSNK